MESIDFPTITVKAATWSEDHETLSAIRRTVFIEGQQVPEALELDGLDVSAYHWLAYDGGKPVGTMRLESNGKVGRMAVYDEYRGRGIGSALLRHCIQFAAKEGFNNLYLHAQVHALDFYAGFGFVASSERFDEAGISHQSMSLDLGPYRHLAQKLTSEMKAIATQPELINTCTEMLQQTRRTVRCYSRNLTDEWLNAELMIPALQQLATKHTESKIEVLVADISGLASAGSKLLELQRRLSSRIAIRQLSKDQELPEEAFFILSDDENYIKSAQRDGVVAHQFCHARADLRSLEKHFLALWQHASTPAELREMRI